MLDNASKAFFHLLARSGTLKKLASRYGMRSPTSFARRFIAGETVEEAIAAARQVEAAGLLQTLDYLGESVATLAEADAATRDYLRVIDAIIARRHRPQPVAEADAARARRRSRERRRQPAPHSRSRAGLLRAPRHGELAVHRNDARDFRDALAAELPEHRRRAAGGSAAAPSRTSSASTRSAHGSAS